VSFEWERTGVDLIAYLQVGRLGHAPRPRSALVCRARCSVYASEGVNDCG
jgi:hypothetical protein